MAVKAGRVCLLRRMLAKELKISSVSGIIRIVAFFLCEVKLINLWMYVCMDAKTDFYEVKRHQKGTSHVML